MAEIHRTTLTPSKVELLTAWLPRQRWYRSAGVPPVLTRRGGFRLDDPAGRVGVEILVVSDDAAAADGGPSVTYQVPLTYRDSPLPGAEHALVGTSEHGVLGTRYVYDAPHDPVYVAQLLALLAGRVGAQAQSLSDTPDPRFQGHAVTAGALDLASSRVLTGEQSNTSVVCEITDDDDARSSAVVVKLFRTLAAGENPDVGVTAALTAQSSPHVPPVVGYVDGPWTDASTGDEVRGDLAVAQEFVPGAQDAWTLALRAARAGDDFTQQARDLGTMTAGLHADLARALGVTPTDDAARAWVATSMRDRLAEAVAADPPLASRRGAIEARLAAFAAAPWPDLQRVHGDLHLGQVLRATAPDGSAAGTWVAVDFEGEPLRPLAERARPDLALRDVAGMLRSFDYAAAEAPEDTWASAARAAFLDGYRSASGLDLAAAQTLLGALELDKAVYELTYELRHRPDWAWIPRAAIERLLA
ncbi:aminoglycoside phosphotransferase [Beutenbergia cavernae DSM 12333]|uniref:Maltokinase n=1 Tax=Beutenbergia cavernae (strain ATCC BAA-8 / DSM 12333 / CCUG 43141 / JCM 11478 / NBRC 16432 / NCIMB 13614 / HKI 0122) TaxID=471853 RepID=C5C1X6_BEUC1|nr:aminoglycoside phosphotransferase [Beutenbergia cavernae]ACQ79594.1 aminoglycoside phosphotransferase [Beutenbergia cavernae DSM 12333]